MNVIPVTELQTHHIQPTLHLKHHILPSPHVGHHIQSAHLHIQIVDLSLHTQPNLHLNHHILPSPHLSLHIPGIAHFGVEIQHFAIAQHPQ